MATCRTNTADFKRTTFRVAAYGLSKFKMNLRSSRVYSAPVPKMPPGLVELMEGLARDVLKDNPTDVYAFCADHMQKLIQIRDGLTTNKGATLKEKIAFATKKVRDRAAQRQVEFDKKMQLFQSVQSDNNKQAEQYIQQNIVKIPQNHLTNNREHEIIAGSVKENLIKSEYVQDTDAQMVFPLPDTNKDSAYYPNCDSIHNVPNSEHNTKNAEIELSSKNKDENEPGEWNIVNLDKVNISEDAKNDENLLEQQEIFEKEESNVVLPEYENVEHSNQHNTSNITELVVCTQVQDRSNIEIANIKINNEEHLDYKKEHGSSEFQRSLEEHNTEKDERHSVPESTPFENNDNYETHVNVQDSFDKDVEISGSAAFENNLEQNIEPVEKDKYNQLTGHVHNTSMDLETAAITIQKVFRSFLFKNKTLSVDDSTNIDINLLIEDKEKKDDEAMPNNNINKDRRPLGINRMDTVLQTVKEEKSLSLSTDDSSTLSSAATIIQAHVRGFLVRNNYNFNKTVSSTSGIDSDGQSLTSLECDNNYNKNKTVLNIHIVPEGGHFMSRDESILTSVDLSLDGSPPSTTNLHPLGYDKSERRKLTREDAIQSISPPSCNSGKLSEDVDSVKEVIIDGDINNTKSEREIASDDMKKVSSSTDTFNDDNISTMVDIVKSEETVEIQEYNSANKSIQLKSMSQMASDELDVVTPHVISEEKVSSENAVNNAKLMHSGEYHDVVLPTKVSRNETSVVRGE